MIGVIVRVLMILAGSITSFFVAKDELQFDIVQMIVAVILFTVFVGILAFWPFIKRPFKRIFNKRKS